MDDVRAGQPALDGQVEGGPRPLQVHVYTSELWTGVYADGALAAQGLRIPTEAWLQLLRRSGAEYAVYSVGTATPPPGSDVGRVRVEFSAALPSGDWPASEAELRELIERRQRGFEAVQTLVDDVERARQELRDKEKGLKLTLDRLGIAYTSPDVS
jgi:hypothetical protein